MRLIGRADFQYLGVIQRQRDTWLGININCHGIFHATVPRKVSRQQIHKIMICGWVLFFSFRPIRAPKTNIMLPSNCSLFKDADRRKCQLTKGGHINSVGCQPLPFEGLETHTPAFMHHPRDELCKAPTLPWAPPSIMFVPGQGGEKTQTGRKSLGTVCERVCGD